MPWVKNLCRLCGQIGDVCFNILGSESSYNLQQKIKKCLNIEINKDDFKPKEICSLCCTKLNEISNFLDLVYATNMKFDAIYYTEPWHQSLNDRLLCDNNAAQNFIQKQQSVIVSNSNKQGFENFQSYSSTAENSSIMILQHYSTNNLMNYGTNINGNMPNYNDFASFSIKSENNAVTKKKQCQVSDGTSNQFLESVQSQQKNLLSIDDIKKSLKPQSVAKNNLKPSKLYPCPHCEKTFMRRSNLNAHIAYHTKIRPYACSICSKTFAVKCHLTQHHKIHSNKFQCHVCHKNFDVPSKLSRHIRIHTNEKPFVCTFPQCSKSFADNNNLKYHSLTHLNDKQFSCDICMKMFKSRKNLRTHLRTHVDDSRFHCKLCQKGFKYKHNLKNHLIKHGVNIQNNMS